MNSIYKFVPVIALLLVSFSSSAQKSLIAHRASDIESIDFINLSQKNNTTLLKNAQSKHLGQLIFAEKIEKSISCLDQGTWESMPDDKMLWRLRIRSGGASSLNFAFYKYYLPKGATLLIYSPDQSYVLGPFTNYDNSNHGQLWTPIIPYDELILELQLPENQKKYLDLEIGEINHGFKDYQKSFSQSCNLDVICGEADGYEYVDRFRDQIRSVGVYSIEGTRLCTGALVNNTRNDCTPYFLTANHCGISQENAPSIVVHWNYENSICRMPGSVESGGIGDGILDQFNSGASLVSTYSPSDMTLLVLEEDVPASSNTYFAGWNINMMDYDSTVCIHHPNVEEKRISIDFDGLSLFEDDSFYWQVDNWEEGSTQSGSSGAPLFNKNGEIIGQEFGGQADCSNDLWDVFGRLDLSWNGNNTPTGRLKDWLDPINSGVSSLKGRGCTSILTSSEDILRFCSSDDSPQSILLSVNDGFSQSAQLSVVNPVEGINITFSSNFIAKDESSIANITVDDGVPEGEYEIEIDADDGATRASKFIEVIVWAELPADFIALSPTGTSSVGTNVDFEWEGSADTYDIEISEDPSFDTLNGSSLALTQTYFKVSNLVQKTDYFWRVRGTNACGTGPWSEYQFTTGEIQCRVYSASDLPLVIDEEVQSSVISNIDIGENEVITDVNILNVTGEHTWISDLEFRLISPANTEIVLISRECNSERNFDLGFDDESELTLFNCPFNDQLIYKPTNPLSQLVDETSQGRWRLQVLDLSDLDGGQFTDWSLEICTNISKTISTSEEEIDNLFRIYPNPSSDIIFIDDREKHEKLTFKIRSISGNLIHSGHVQPSIDISSISGGIYFLELIENRRLVGIKKIVITK